MKKIKKKVFPCILIVILLFALAGCGKNENKDRRDDWGETTTEEMPDTATKLEAEETGKEASKTDAIKSSETDAAVSKSSQTDAVSKTDSQSGADKAQDEPEDNSPINGKVIVLDPGHSNVVTGGTEPIGPGSSEMKAADASGTRGTTTGLTEIELNFQIAEKLKIELQERGYIVLLTRYDNDTAISCSERAEVANSNKADAFIRIHADGSDSSSASGAMAICITPSNPYIASMYSESRILSDDILNEYVAATGFSSRGVWETDTMTGNNWSEVPCTLLEMGFMTNPNEDTLMADPDFQTKMVTGIANGIDKYFFTD